MAEKPIVLVGPDCGGAVEGCEAENALKDDDEVFTQDEGKDALWTASLRGVVEDPICLVTLHGDGTKSAVPHGLTGVVIDVMSDARTVAWSSPILIPKDHLQLHVHVPFVQGRRLRIRKCFEYGKGLLSFRYVQCFVRQNIKYKLSKNILTIDKFSVAQPFSLAELAHSTAYNNLYTASACYELSSQESYQEEREQEALNLTHHLAGIWNGKTFNHGAHIGTVRVVLLSMLETVKQIFAREARLVDVPGPCYVFGDIHGNFQDLLYFMSNLIPFKHIKYSSHNYLFLGDYVDRGKFDVECLAYLVALKVQAPHKIFLLRGNHEDRKQNTKLEESFLRHCCELFGQAEGEEVWKKANEAFDAMPLCGVIENKIFCCHGGVPQVPEDDDGKQIPIRQAISYLSNPLPTINDSDDPFKQIACDLLWADPAQDRSIERFGRNEARGCSIVFGQQAVEDFLNANGFECLFRAHQSFSFGVNISKSAKVITLFSSSNYCDNNSCAGCALVTGDKRIQLLMKEHSPHVQS